MDAYKEYVVEYVDDRPETTNFLKREGTVKITYRNGDSYEGVIGADKLKQGDGKYVWRQKTDDGEGAYGDHWSLSVCEGLMDGGT
jgi:hypothetical protein